MPILPVIECRRRASESRGAASALYQCTGPEVSPSSIAACTAARGIHESARQHRPDAGGSRNRHGRVHAAVLDTRGALLRVAGGRRSHAADAAGREARRLSRLAGDASASSTTAARIAAPRSTWAATRKAASAASTTAGSSTCEGTAWTCPTCRRARNSRTGACQGLSHDRTQRPGVGVHGPAAGIAPRPCPTSRPT